MLKIIRNENKVMENDATPYASIIATAIIQIVLVILKLTNVFTCSWWLILIPFELAAGATVITFIIIDVILIVEMYKDYRAKRRKK